MPDYTDSFFEIGWDATIGTPVFWRYVNKIEIVRPFDLTPRVPEDGDIVWIADIPASVFWPLWVAARKEYADVQNQG